MALMAAVAAMTSANWRYIWPLRPGRKAAGTNTAISTSVMPMMGPSSSCMALTVASCGVRPCSMCLAAPSTTTIASSTTMPIARMMANSVVRLTENPNAAIAAKAPMMVTGTVVAGTRVARQSCRKTRITTSTSTAASIRVL